MDVTGSSGVRRDRSVNNRPSSSAPRGVSSGTDGSPAKSTKPSCLPPRKASWLWLWEGFMPFGRGAPASLSKPKMRAPPAIKEAFSKSLRVSFGRSSAVMAHLAPLGGQEGAGFSKLGSIAVRVFADSRKLGVEALRHFEITRELCGARRPIQAVEPVGRFLERHFVCRQGLGGLFQFEEQVAQCLTRRHRQVVNARGILAVSGITQGLERLFILPLGIGDPRRRFCVFR